MKNLIRLVACCGCVAILLLHSCTQTADDPGAGTFDLIKLYSDTVNLKRGDSTILIRDLSTSANIVAQFSANIDISTVSPATVTLTTDSLAVPMNFIIEGHTLTMDPVSDLLSGQTYKLHIDTAVKSRDGIPFVSLTRKVQTSGIGIDTPPQATEQVLYMQLNGNTNDVTGNSLHEYYQLSYGIDRFDVASFAGAFRLPLTGGAGDIVEMKGVVDSTILLPPSITLSFWIDFSNHTFLQTTSAVMGLAADKGYYIDMTGDTTLGAHSITFATNHKTSSGYHTSFLTFADEDTGTNDTILFHDPIMLKDSMKYNAWNHLVFTYDAATSTKTFYLNGFMRQQGIAKDPATNMPLGDIVLDVPPKTVVQEQLAIGYYCSKANTGTPQYFFDAARNTLVGELDDLRMFKVALTATEVKKLYLIERPLN